jgi:hypothetical protein
VARRLRGAAIKALWTCLAEFILMAFLRLHQAKMERCGIFFLAVTFRKMVILWYINGISVGYQWDINKILMAYEWL